MVVDFCRISCGIDFHIRKAITEGHVLEDFISEPVVLNFY